MKRLALAIGLLTTAALAQPVIPLTTASVPISISTIGTTQIVTAPTLTGPGGVKQSIYVTAVDIIAGATDNVQFVYGTGTNCGTGQGNITGNYSLTAQVGFTKGGGSGILWVIPPGNALCLTTTTTATVPGSLSYAIF